MPQNYMSFRRGVFLLMVPLALALVLPVIASADYTYDDNVREYLATGISNLEKGKLSEAEIDFENVLAIEPGHVGARERLLDVYILRDKKAQAQKAVAAMVSDGVLSGAKLQKFETRIAALKGTGLAPKPPTKKPTAAPKPTQVARPTKASGPTKKPRKTVKNMTPKEKFNLAISYKNKVDKAKRKGRSVGERVLTQAIVLFVAAIQANPALLGQDDAGLLELSRKHYTRKMKEDPQNPQNHFFVGYFHDIFSEYEKAKSAYEQVAKLAPNGSRLQKVARSKVESLKVQIASRQRAAEEQKKEDERKKKFSALETIRKGEAEGVEGADAYAIKGKNIYGKWTKEKNNDLLDEAAAWLEGAIKQKEDSADFHYTIALIFIEKATIGDRAAKTRARGHLQKVLSLNAPDNVRKSAEQLLASLSSTSQPEQPKYQRRSPPPVDKP